MSKQTLLSTLFACICLVTVPILRVQGSAPAPARSPEADTELICHTHRLSDCYPAVFQPTEEFQVIHDDQSIPPGLHVRLDLATGLKEARLNVPEPEDAPQADLVIIDNPPASTEEQASLSRGIHNQEKHLLSQERSIEFEGTPPSDSDSEVEVFKYYQRNAAAIFNTPITSSNEDDVLTAMNALTELAHSLELGLAIASDPVLVHIFVDLVHPNSSSPIPVRSAATQLLGTAMQNNPEALEEFLAHFKKPITAYLQPINILHAVIDESKEGEQIPEIVQFQKRLIFLLSQLCHDPKQLQYFVATSGLSSLLAVFSVDNMSFRNGCDQVRGKIANFLSDHVLPVMANWEGGSLLKEPPPGVNIKMTVRQSTWMNAIHEMKSWCSTFERAIKMAGVGVDGPMNGSLGAWESILGTSNALDDVLKMHGAEEGCTWNPNTPTTNPETEEL